MRKNILFCVALGLLAGFNCSTVDSAIDYEGATITIVVQGGYAGIYDKLVVEPCGMATRYVRIGYPYEYRVQTLRLSESEHSLLLAHFEGFFLLEESYAPERPCIDCFDYWITFATPTRSKTVYTPDGADGERPKQLQTIIEDFWSITAKFQQPSN
jgi:hypothetical protein